MECWPQFLKVIPMMCWSLFEQASTITIQGLLSMHTCNNSTQIMGNCLEVENSEYAAEQTIDKWTRKVREEASIAICDTNNFDHFCFFRVYQSMHYVNYEHFFAVESKVC